MGIESTQVDSRKSMGRIENMARIGDEEELRAQNRANKHELLLVNIAWVTNGRKFSRMAHNQRRFVGQRGETKCDHYFRSSFSKTQFIRVYFHRCSTSAEKYQRNFVNYHSGQKKQNPSQTLFGWWSLFCRNDTQVGGTNSNIRNYELPFWNSGDFRTTNWPMVQHTGTFHSFYFAPHEEWQHENVFQHTRKRKRSTIKPSKINN